MKLTIEPCISADPFTFPNSVEFFELNSQKMIIRRIDEFKNCYVLATQKFVHLQNWFGMMPGQVTHKRCSRFCECVEASCAIHLAAFRRAIAVRFRSRARRTRFGVEVAWHFWKSEFSSAQKEWTGNPGKYSLQMNYQCSPFCRRIWRLDLPKW